MAAKIDLALYLDPDPQCWGWNVSREEIGQEVEPMAERLNQRLAEAIGRYMRKHWPGVRYHIRERFHPQIGEAFTRRGRRALEDLQHAMETLWIDVLKLEPT